MVDLKDYFWKVQKTQIDINLAEEEIKKKESELRKSEPFRIIQRNKDKLRTMRKKLKSLIMEAPLG